MKRRSLVLVAMACSLPAHASIVTYTSSADFFAVLASFTTESFDSDPPDTVIPDGIYNGLTYTFPAGKDGRIDALYNRIGASSLAATPAAGFFFPGESVTVTFPSPVTAVGMYFNVGVSPVGSLTVTTSEGVAGNGATYDVTTLYFVGLTSTIPFSSALSPGAGPSPAGTTWTSSLTARRFRSQAPLSW